MDITTLIGLISITIVVVGAIFLGGNILGFIDIPSILIVIGGTLGSTLIRISLKQFLGSFKVAMKAFINRPQTPMELIQEAVNLATVARKEGILALENQEISHPFLQKGISLCIDGHPPETVEMVLSKEIALTIERHDIGVSMFKAIADFAPAYGMIGTLIGLVQMLSNMEDPKTIGPAMAVALLTTLYGALIANGFALPIADKLRTLSDEERMTKDLILQAISSIQSGVNPRVMEQILMTYLPGSQRPTEEEEKG